MDRVIVYPGQIPLDTDFLSAQRFAQIGLAKDAETILGAGPLADGFACIPTTPASMAVQVLPGVLFATSALDAASYGTLAADITHQLVKQGIALDTTNLTLVAPVTSGHAVNYLIQAAFTETDEVPVVLPYYNATTPSQPFSGPENSGGAQYTKRSCKVVVSAKAGVSATSGTQVTPSPDAGYVPLYVVTIAQGQTSITSPNISKHASSPFLPAKLPVIPAGVRDQLWSYGADTGSANALAVALSPIPTAYVAGMGIEVKVAATNSGAATIAVNGMATKQIVRADGSALQAGDLIIGMVARLVYDGTKFQLSNSMGIATLASAGNGTEVYEGLSGGVHYIRSLIQGTNITLTLVEHPASSGHYGIRIDAAGGGGGGGANVLGNVGAGQNVYKGLNAGIDEFRTLSGRDLIDVVLGGTGNNEVKIGLTDVVAWSVAVRNDAAAGKLAGVPISALTEDTAPASNDWLMLGKNSNGELKKVSVSKIRELPAWGIGTVIIVKNANVAAGTTLTTEALAAGAPGGTWVKLGPQYWFAATESGDGSWLGMAVRTA